MKKERKNTPLEILIALVSKGRGENVRKILVKNNCKHNMIYYGHGSTNNSFGQSLGFGIQEIEVVIAVVPVENAEDLTEEIAQKAELHISKNGIVMTLPINGASNTTLELLKMGGKK